MNLLLKITRHIRTAQVLKHLEPKEKHLDIGCGRDMHLLKKSLCRIKKGIDAVFGQKIKKKIRISEKFDYITMVAVIEHLEHPRDVVKECHRLLKPEGVLIITTPTKAGNCLMALYAPKARKQHANIFNKKSIAELLHPYFKIEKYKKFEFGLNQIIVARRRNYAKQG